MAVILGQGLQPWRAGYLKSARVQDYLIGVVAVARLAVAWVEIGILSRRMTRAIQVGVGGEPFFPVLPRVMILS
jgi:hypothetical protein